MSLAFTPHGDPANPPLVILHGLFGSGRNWTSVAKALSADWYVRTVDLPNHGRSAWVEEPLTYPLLAQAVIGFLDEQGLENPVVLGHSMGGKTAMTLALTVPERVGALAIVDIAPVVYNSEDREHADYIDAMQGVDTTRYTRRAEVEAALMDKIGNESIRKFLMQNLVTDEATGGLRWQINLDGLKASLPFLMDFPAGQTAPPYRGSSHFIVGGASNYVRAKSEPEIARLFPRALIDRLPGAGHWPHAEVPGVFLEKLGEFLAGLQ